MVGRSITWANRGRVVGVAVLSALSNGCMQPRVRYHGHAHPAAVAGGEDVMIFGGRAEPPHRHVVIGAVVASMPTVEQDVVIRALRRQVAHVGGTAIHRLDCETRRAEDDEAFEGATVTTCGANVLRARAVDEPVDLAEHGDVQLELEHTQVALLTVTDVASLASEQEHDQIGILEAHPIDHAYFGETAATCEGSCPRSTLSRAIRMAAGKRGAVAIAGLRCDLDGAVSRCTASLVGPHLDSVVAPEAIGPRLAQGRHPNHSPRGVAAP